MAKRMKKRRLPAPSPKRNWTTFGTALPTTLGSAPDRDVRDGREGICGPVTLAHRDVNPNPYVRIRVNEEAAEIVRWTRAERRYCNVIAEARTDKAKTCAPYDPDVEPGDGQFWCDAHVQSWRRAQLDVYAVDLDAWLDRMAERGERPVPRGVEMKCDAHVRMWARSADSMTHRTLNPFWRA